MQALNDDRFKAVVLEALTRSLFDYVQDLTGDGTGTISPEQTDTLAAERGVFSSPTLDRDRL